MMVLERRISDLSLYGSLGLGGRSRCVAAAPWAGWPPDRVAAAKISTALDTPRRHERGARRSILAATEGRTQLPCSPNGRAPVSGGWTPGWCYADDGSRTLLPTRRSCRPACNKCRV